MVVIPVPGALHPNHQEEDHLMKLPYWTKMGLKYRQEVRAALLAVYNDEQRHWVMKTIVNGGATDVRSVSQGQIGQRK